MDTTETLIPHIVVLSYKISVSYEPEIVLLTLFTC